VRERLDVDPAEGLDDDEAARRLERHGPNRLREAKRVDALEIAVRQFRSLLVALLSVAAVVSFAFGEWLEAAAIAGVLMVNAVLGFVAEIRAVRSMEALRQLGSVQVRVRRGGDERELDADALVPGDVVLVEGGDVVAADLRLLEASKLQADESILTGESLPVGKGVEPLDADTPLVERRNMLFKGTPATRGSATGVVVATGMETALGEIADLAEEAEEEVTPLERRLEELGHRLIWVTLAIAAATTLAGVVAGRPALLMVQTGIALAVAAVPEGLPIVATMALARGMWRLARRNALINRLSAVETLGATSLILTDKTGTLTENRMTARVFRLADHVYRLEEGDEPLRGSFHREDDGGAGPALDPLNEDGLRRCLEVGALCNNASLLDREQAPGEGVAPDEEPAGEDDEGRDDDGEDTALGVGDPLEVSLLVAAARAGIDRQELVDRSPEVREEAFDPATKMMATFHRQEGRVRVAVKGAAEAVLEASDRILRGGDPVELDDEEREGWLEHNRRMAARGLRVLALAEKSTDDADTAPYESLTFLGLVGLLDPARSDVREALEACDRAGIRVVMVTGDQEATARTVAEEVGLVAEGSDAVASGREVGDLSTVDDSRREELRGVSIFARVDPAQKLELIRVHQEGGCVVAMTGDGVNDAPALKKADIGVAMGQRGTQVAQEAADMVLIDDAFSSIVAAVRQGRVIFGNIRKFVVYLLSCNVSEIMIVGGASALTVPLPILPLQILFLNLVTDVFPALALAAGEGDPGVMDRPPRDPEEPIVGRDLWLRIAGFGAVITVCVLVALFLARGWLDMPVPQAVTVSFLTLAMAQLFHVFNMRDPGSSFWRNDIVANGWVWGAVALCIGLILGAVYLPGANRVLETVDPGLAGWGLVLGMSLVPWILGQVWASVRRE